MKLNFDINALFNNRLTGPSKQANEKVTHSYVQVKTTEFDEHANLHQTKKILKNRLTELSPQSLNALYQSAQDNRVQVYIDNEEKEVYETFVDRATRQFNFGKANGESSKQLNELLQRISQGSEQAHTETRSILAGLGKLDASTESYIAQSTTYTRFSLDELASTIAADEEFEPITDSKTFSLQVTTREGDTVEVKIKQGDNWGESTYANNISVNYEVEGNLSQSEKDALSELMNAIGTASDSLLAGNDFTQLMGIENFNGQQLSGFSLALKGSNQDINYNYQHNDNKQTLTGSWSQKGQIKAKFNMQSQLGGDASHEQLARYLELLDQAAESSYKNNDDKDQSDQTSALFSNTFTDFMQLADTLGKSLSSVDQQFTQTRAIANQLFNETIKNQSNRLGLKDEQQATLKEGFNQLADFSANFVAQKGGVKSQGKNEPKMGYQIELAQKSNFDSNLIDGVVTKSLKQSQTVKFDAVMQGVLNSRSQKFSEQYEIMAAFDETAQFKGYKQSRNSSEQSKQQIYQQLGEYSFSEIDKRTLSENELYLLKEGSLENSKADGFEDITKGFKAGDAILSQMEFHNSLHFQASLFSAKDQTFQDNLQSQLSIASQKQLLDAILDEL